MNKNNLVALCQQLQLSTIASRINKALEQAVRQQVGYDEFFADLLSYELETRLQRRFVRRVKEAGFPSVKTLDNFNFARSSYLPETLIRKLTQGEYIQKAEPIIFIGEPGTGKTHLACALGYAAARQGTHVRFTSTAQLVNTNHNRYFYN